MRQRSRRSRVMAASAPPTRSSPSSASSARRRSRRSHSASPPPRSGGGLGRGRVRPRRHPEERPTSTPPTGKKLQCPLPNPPPLRGGGDLERRLRRQLRAAFLDTGALQLAAGGHDV